MTSWKPLKSSDHNSQGEQEEYEPEEVKQQSSRECPIK